MADYKVLVPFILGWEGGIDNDKDDKGGYSNYGITYNTYKSLSLKVLAKEPNLEHFKELTKEEAALFIKHFFYKATGKNTIKSQKIAEAVTTWYWGSGILGLKQFQNLINSMEVANKLVSDGIIGWKTTRVVNSMNSNQLFIEMIKFRKNFFKDIVRRDSSQKKFLKGWLNRLNAFYLRHKTENDPNLKIIE